MTAHRIPPESGTARAPAPQKALPPATGAPSGGRLLLTPHEARQRLGVSERGLHDLLKRGLTCDN